MPPEKLAKMKEFTIFLILTSDYSGADGYARILTYSINGFRLNFMVGQWKDSLVFEIKDDKRDLPLHYEVNKILPRNELTSVAVVFDGDNIRMFKNGELRGTRKTGPLAFSTWNKEYPLVMGSEAHGKETWQGTVYSAAIFDQALSPQEIKTLPSAIANLSPVIWYDFERKGTREKEEALNWFDWSNWFNWLKHAGWLTNKTHGTNQTETTHPPIRSSTHWLLIPDLGKGKPADLVAPYYFKPYKKPVLEKMYTNLEEYRKNVLDILVNIAGFIPLGFLLALYITQKGLSLSKALLLSIFAGFVISLTIELLQYFLPTRTSSMPDLVANVCGTGIGAMMLRIKDEGRG